MKNLVLHIGTEKTGSSSLQSFLNINRQQLGQSGIDYPQTPGKRNHRKLAVYCCKDEKKLRNQISSYPESREISSEAWKAKFIKAFNREICRLPSQNEKVILSSEHFHSRVTGKDEIKILKETLKKHFAQIKIIIYLRRQDEQAVSLYSTYCRGLGTRRTPLPQNIKEGNIYYNHNRALNRWASIFGDDNIIVRVYDVEKLKGGNIISDFFSLAGIPGELKDYRIPERENTALSLDAQKLFIQMNCLIESACNPLVKIKLKAYKDSCLKRSSYLLPGKSVQPSVNDAKAFYEIFEKSNQMLSSKWLDIDNMFSDDFSFYPEKSMRLNLNWFRLSFRNLLTVATRWVLFSYCYFIKVYCFICSEINSVGGKKRSNSPEL